MAQLPQNSRMERVQRRLFTALGLLFVGLGILGYILPVMPGTVFMILALYCFSKGNERLEQWLLEHPRFGPTLRDWKANKSIRMRTKVIAISMLWLAILFSISIIGKLWVKWMLFGIAAWVTWYIASRKTADPIFEPATESQT